MIDWAVAHGNADVQRVGMAGISYGRGSACSPPPRTSALRAVAAMSGWADLKASIYPNETLTELSGGGLLLAGNITGRPGEDMKELQAAYVNNDFGPVLPKAASRGAQTYLSEVNTNHPAIMMSNTWGDSIFPPSQIADFCNGLTGPKRLMLQPGDHGTTDVFGALGLPNDAWASATRWFDHYLNGMDNGIDRAAPVNIKSVSGGGGGWLGFPDWTSMGPRTRTYSLGSAGLGRGAATGWQNRIAAGVPTVADSGIIFATASPAGGHPGGRRGSPR